MSARWSALVWPVLAVALAAGRAGAAPRALDYVEVAPSPYWHAAPDRLYLNSCATGCTVVAGGDDAVSDRSSILGREGIPSQVTLAPFGWDPAVWDAMVACVRDTYAVYGVTVVTEPPVGPHAEVMVGGTAASLGLDGNTLGIAPLANDCSALSSAIGFAFANAHLDGPQLVDDLCATVAHEAGHLFGLDHEFDCRDPMTYLTGCGRKTFFNRTVQCGEFDGPRPCKCDDRQNSHVHLFDRLGPGAAPTPPPVAIVYPLDAAAVTTGFAVFAQVGGRPVGRVELWINGALIATAEGRADDTPYELRTGAGVPDGVLDLEAIAYDDLGQVGSGRITVTKGTPCGGPADCPSGQTCDQGRCLTAAGTGQVGDGCGGPADCAGRECAVRGEQAVCSQPCWPAGAACPAGLSCKPGDDEGYACFGPDPGCGCGAQGGRGTLALAGLVLLALWRRRAPSVRGRRRCSSR